MCPVGTKEHAARPVLNSTYHLLSKKKFFLNKKKSLLLLKYKRVSSDFSQRCKFTKMLTTLNLFENKYSFVSEHFLISTGHTNVRQKRPYFLFLLFASFWVHKLTVDTSLLVHAGAHAHLSPRAARSQITFTHICFCAVSLSRFSAAAGSARHYRNENDGWAEFWGDLWKRTWDSIDEAWQKPKRPGASQEG